MSVVHSGVLAIQTGLKSIVFRFVRFIVGIAVIHSAQESIVEQNKGRHCRNDNTYTRKPHKSSWNRTCANLVNPFSPDSVTPSLCSQDTNQPSKCHPAPTKHFDRSVEALPQSSPSNYLRPLLFTSRTFTQCWPLLSDQVPLEEDIQTHTLHET